MNSILRSAAVLALAAAALAASAQVGPVIFNARGTTNPFNTQRAAGNAPLAATTFAAPTTIGAFGVFDALSAAGTQTFLIFNLDTSTLLFQSAPKAFAGDGGTAIGLDNYKVSDPLSFTFLPGVNYGIGATASVNAGYFAALDSVTQNGVTVSNSNGNVTNTTLSSTGAASTGLILYAPANPTPEPSALAALGLGAVAFVKRRRRA